VVGSALSSSTWSESNDAFSFFELDSMHLPSRLTGVWSSQECISIFIKEPEPNKSTWCPTFFTVVPNIYCSWVAIWRINSEFFEFWSVNICIELGDRVFATENEFVKLMCNVITHSNQVIFKRRICWETLVLNLLLFRHVVIRIADYQVWGNIVSIQLACDLLVPLSQVSLFLLQIIQFMRFNIFGSRLNVLMNL
jgi:hypothetical protein